MGVHAAIVVSVLLAALAAGCTKSEAATADSRQLFANACARCHGADGAGGIPSFGGGPAPRNFRDRDFQRGRTDEQLKMTIRDGKGSGMPPFGSMFDDAQLAALVAQIRSFDPDRK
ncbi:MAG: cytochrome c [Labilithrix sp.]|nr:cytochrome c [Labilithrix sp.]